MAEGDMFARYIISSVDHLLDCLDDVDEIGLNWRPDAMNANSLYAIASHTIANAAENVLGTACDRPEHKVRNEDAEFLINGRSVSDLRERWARVADEVQRSLSGLTAEVLQEERAHPRRGSITTREVLLVAARHAAEHYGQAQMTRDLYLAQK